MNHRYVLVTAVRNEEPYLEKTIKSVVAQTIKPIKWTIVNDGSTDRTGEIISWYSSRHNFIKLINIMSENDRNFASKVRAIHEGIKSFQGMAYEFIGNIDGDIEIGLDYFECLLSKFKEDEMLGIAGGWIHEKQKGRYVARFGNSENSVPGSIQTFRRLCFESIGNYLSLSTGGEDYIAEVMARMHGWSTRSYPPLIVYHQRPTGTAKAYSLCASYRSGKSDYFVGYHPVFEAFKCLRRIYARPVIIGSFLRFVGYMDGLWSKEPITVPINVIEYLRKEQMNRIKSLITGSDKLIAFKRHNGRSRA